MISIIDLVFHKIAANKWLLVLNFYETHHVPFTTKIWVMGYGCYG